MKKLFFAIPLVTVLSLGCGNNTKSENEVSQDTTLSQSTSSTSTNDSTTSDSLAVDTGGQTMPKKPEQP